VLQCVAVCCSVLQCVAVCCSGRVSTYDVGYAVCCSVLQCVALGEYPHMTLGRMVSHFVAVFLLLFFWS